MDLAEYLKAPYGRVVVPESDGTFRAEITEFPGCSRVQKPTDKELAAYFGFTGMLISYTLTSTGPHLRQS